MTQSTITSKGQTTLPAHIRRALHLKTGDKILYEIRRGFGGHPPAARGDGGFRSAQAVCGQNPGCLSRKPAGNPARVWVADTAREGRP